MAIRNCDKFKVIATGSQERKRYIVALTLLMMTHGTIIHLFPRLSQFSHAKCFASPWVRSRRIALLFCFVHKHKLWDIYSYIPFNHINCSGSICSWSLWMARGRLAESKSNCKSFRHELEKLLYISLNFIICKFQRLCKPISSRWFVC